MNHFEIHVAMLIFQTTTLQCYIEFFVVKSLFSLHTILLKFLYIF